MTKDITVTVIICDIEPYKMRDYNTEVIIDDVIPTVVSGEHVSVKNLTFSGQKFNCDITTTRVHDVTAEVKFEIVYTTHEYCQSDTTGDKKDIVLDAWHATGKDEEIWGSEHTWSGILDNFKATGQPAFETIYKPEDPVPSWMKLVATDFKYKSSTSESEFTPLEYIQRGTTPGYGTFTNTGELVDGKLVYFSGVHKTADTRELHALAWVTATETADESKKHTGIFFRYYNYDTNSIVNTFLTADDIPGVKIKFSILFSGKTPEEIITTADNCFTQLGYLPKCLGCIAWGQGGNGWNGTGYHLKGYGGGGAGIAIVSLTKPQEEGCYQFSPSAVYFMRSTGTCACIMNLPRGSSGTSTAPGTGSEPALVSEYENLVKVLKIIRGGNGRSNTDGSSRSAITVDMGFKHNLIIESAGAGGQGSETGYGGGWSFGNGGDGDGYKDAKSAGWGGGGGGNYGMATYNKYAGGPAGIVLFY